MIPAIIRRIPGSHIECNAAWLAKYAAENKVPACIHFINTFRAMRRQLPYVVVA